MRRLFASSWRHRPVGGHTSDSPRNAFTLVELLVAVVILTILASLSLAGLAGVRQRGKADKTRSTIRKLHETIMPQYESYTARRVSTQAAPTPSRTQCPTCYAAGDPNSAPSRTRSVVAWKSLVTKRSLVAQELPDQWADVATGQQSTGPGFRYAAYKNALSTAGNPQWVANQEKYEGAECLAMIVLQGGIDPEAAEQFRADEIGDIDSDGAAEFWDGWNRPIGFIRWAAGFASIAQPQNTNLNPDPLDPFQVSGAMDYPAGVPQTDYALIPLIYSCGPSGASDEPLTTRSGYSIDPTLHWLQATPLSSTRVGSPVAGEISDATIASDNITNHDLSKR